jgi:anti-sigma factor RsiW
MRWISASFESFPKANMRACQNTAMRSDAVLRAYFFVLDSAARAVRAGLSHVATASYALGIL